MRQLEVVELIASENFPDERVIKACGTEFMNKYAEGYPEKKSVERFKDMFPDYTHTGNTGRYYGGCDCVDMLELYTRYLFQRLFNTNYHVNVQPHSGSQANEAAYPDYISCTGDGYAPSIYKKYGVTISRMGCRANLSPWYERGGMEPADENDKPVYEGRCNLGAISLHFPMIVAKAQQENKDYYEVLTYYLDLCRAIHKRTFSYLSHKKAGTNPLAFCQGGFLNGRLDPEQELGEDFLRPMTMSFGITALNEASVTDAIKDQYDKLLDKEKARINAAKEVLEDRKKDLQDELDALEEQYEAEDKLLELQKAKDRYEAAKANKNTRLYTADKGWQWVSDPQELEDAKSSLDELHKEMERDEAKKAIQDQIDAIDDLIDKCDDALDILGQDWDDYIDHLNLVAEMQGLTMDQLGDQVEGFVDRAIDLIRQYSNALKEAAAAESMLGNGNGKKNTGGNDKPVEKDFWKDTKAGTIISDVIAKSKQQENWYRNNLPNSITNPFPNGVSGVSGTKIAGKIVDDIAKGKRAPLATGAKYVSSSGIYNVDDGNGPEIIARRGRYTRLEVGDGVVPADLTARLFALAKSPEEYIMPKVSGLFATLAANLIGRPGQVQQSAQQPIYIAKVEVTGVEDVDGFLDELTKIVNRKRKV